MENIFQILNGEKRWILREVLEGDLLALENGDEYKKFRSLMRISYEDHLAGKKIYLVVLCNEKIAGQIVIDCRVLKDATKSDGKTCAYLYSFRVFGPYQGQGLGTAMVKFCESFLFKKGFIRVTIAAEKNNPRALKLYERLGFRIYKEEDIPWDFLDDKGVCQKIHEPEWVLEKTLTG